MVLRASQARIHVLLTIALLYPSMSNKPIRSRSDLAGRNNNQALFLENSELQTFFYSSVELGLYLPSLPSSLLSCYHRTWIMAVFITSGSLEPYTKLQSLMHRVEMNLPHWAAKNDLIQRRSDVSFYLDGGREGGRKRKMKKRSWRLILS